MEGHPNDPPDFRASSAHVPRALPQPAMAAAAAERAGPGAQAATIGAGGVSSAQARAQLRSSPPGFERRRGGRDPPVHRRLAEHLLPARPCRCGGGAFDEPRRAYTSEQRPPTGCPRNQYVNEAAAGIRPPHPHGDHIRRQAIWLLISLRFAPGLVLDHYAIEGSRCDLVRHQPDPSVLLCPGMRDRITRRHIWKRLTSVTTEMRGGA